MGSAQSDRAHGREVAEREQEQWIVVETHDQLRWQWRTRYMDGSIRAMIAFASLHNRLRARQRCVDLHFPVRVAESGDQRRA
jgi:hypothetical protein